MKFSLLRRFHLAATGAAARSIISASPLAITANVAWSQAPKTIRIIAPFPPGGTVDVLSRLLGEQISKAHALTVLVENRPGAGGSTAYEAVARAAADGSTLVINANSVVINPILRKVNYDPITSFEPVCFLVRSPQVIVVNSASPFRTLTDLLAAARAKPGELSFATVGPATTQHIGFEQFRRLAQVDLTYVPYPGGAPAINALLGGHITAVLTNYLEEVEQLKAGTLRGLATTSLRRIETLPDVPTAAEVLGNGEYEAEVWFGVVAPAKTPKQVVAHLIDWFTAALVAPDVSAKLADLGLYPVGICGDNFADHIRRQSSVYGRVIRESNIKVD